MSRYHVDLLVDAIQKGNLAEVRRLITYVNVNLKVGNSGDRFLHIAAHYGPLEIAEFLINNYATINVKDDNGVTPLHIALSYQFSLCKEQIDNNGKELILK